MSRRQPAEVRRTRILDAASTLFVHEGLDQTSMDAVASAAGIAKGTVYLYFPSRSDLLAALRQRYAEQLALRARSILRAQRPWTRESLTSAVQAMVVKLVDYVIANRRIHHVLFQEAGVSEEETMAPLRDLLRSTLEDAIDDGGLSGLDPDTAMRFLLDGLHGGLMPLIHQPRQNRDRVLVTLDEVVRRVLAPAS